MGQFQYLNEVNYMSVQELRFTKDSITQVAYYSTKESAKTNRPAPIYDLPRKDDQASRDDDGKYGEKDCEVRADVEGCS